MIKFSNDVETELRTSVVQAREVEPGKYGEMQNNVIQSTLNISGAV